MTTLGREQIAAFLIEYLGNEARGRPVFHYVPDHVFGDQKTKVVSLNNLASLRDYESKVGARRHRRRFRANIWFNGAPAWAEREWIGREIQVGGAVMRILKGTTRCPATEVNPETGEPGCLRHRQRHDPVLGLRPDKPTTIQLLPVQAHSLTIPKQNLDQVTSAAPENVKRAAVGISSHPPWAAGGCGCLYN